MKYLYEGSGERSRFTTSSWNAFALKPTKEVNMAESRRSEPRFKSEGLADMRFAPGGDVKIRVCDVSRSGLRIQTNVQLREGAEVKILLGQTLISADTRYCKAINPDLYEVGVQIIDMWPQEAPPAESAGTGLKEYPKAGISTMPKHPVRLGTSNIEQFSGGGTITGEGLKEPIDCVYEMYVLQEIDEKGKRDPSFFDGLEIVGMIKPHGDPWLAEKLIGRKLSLHLSDGKHLCFSFNGANGRRICVHSELCTGQSTPA